MDIIIKTEDNEEQAPPEDEDMWLYGEDAAAELQMASRQQEEQPTSSAVVEKSSEEGISEQDPLNTTEDEEQNQLNAMFNNDAEDTAYDEEPTESTEQAPNGEVLVEGEKGSDNEDDDEDDDDDIQVTIGDIKTNNTPAFPYGAGPVNLNITKRGPSAFAGQGTALNAAGKQVKAGTLDFDTPGTFNGQSIYDINLDSLEDKPWRKPGADITDYFNYGFTEDTWRIYCDRQKKIRNDISAGTVGSAPISSISAPTGGPKPFITPVKPGDPAISTVNSIVNENSKYSGLAAMKKAGPPPGRKPSGTIDVIGGGSLTSPSMLPSRRPPDSKENFITVLGGRPPIGPPGMPGPPPFGMPPPFGLPPPGMEFPPGMPPGLAPGLHPPLLPNGQPMPFPGPDFIPRFPPPHMQGEPNFDEEGPPYREASQESMERELRERESREYHHRSGERPGRGYPREYGRREEGFRDRGHHYREYEVTPERPPREGRDHEKEYESRRHRDREREKEKDPEKEREYREREGRGDSRRRHHDEREDDSHKSSSSSSSRHKTSKRIKREKDDDETVKH